MPHPLLSSLTLPEKIAQLTAVRSWDLVDEDQRFDPAKADTLLANGIGQISAVAGTLPVSPAQAAEIANAIQTYLHEHTRLGIPALMHEECLAGFCARGATIFPHAIGLASTWQPELIQEMTAAIRQELRAAGAHQALAPVLDVLRDPRWGRCEETLGEDQYLVAATGTAYIRGLQGEDLNDAGLRRGIAATAKHFAAHAASEGGRNCAPVHIGLRELRDVFLFPFEAAVREAGIASFMNAYNEIDGVPCAASRELLTGILRGEWGFDGAVVSDYFAVQRLISQHATAGTKLEAARQALEAGIDIELPAGDCFPALEEAVRQGLLDEAVIDLAVERVLRMKERLGLFENATVKVDQVEAALADPAHRALSKKVAGQSLVLLKNAGDLLPLKKDLTSIAVIGPNADSPRAMLGDYSYIVTFTAARKFEPGDTVEALEALGGRRITSILEGIKQAVSPETEIRYHYGCHSLGGDSFGQDSLGGESRHPSQADFGAAVEAARGAEVAIVVVGDQAGMFNNGTSGENIDRVEAALYGAQAELVRQVCATGTPVVVVLANGRPPVLPEVAQLAQAVLEAWHPGEAGGEAVASALFGDLNPGGKLPVTLLSAVGQSPLSYNLKPVSYKDYLDAPIRPLYAFGHGLSYTTFEYRDLEITPAETEAAEAGGEITIRFTLQNTGERAGEEVAQLYIHDAVASLARPVMELKGFKRVALEAGKAKRITFKLHTDQLSFHDLHVRRVVEPGTFEVMVGSASDDIRLRGAFEVKGATCEVEKMRRFFSVAES